MSAKHARQQIFAHLAPLLASLVDKVEVMSPFDVEQHYTSHINILYTTDEIDLDRTTLQEEHHGMATTFEITVKGMALSTPSRQADEIAAEVSEVLNTNEARLLGEAVIQLQPQSEELEQDNEMETRIAKLSMNYAVFYRNPKGNRKVLI